jgi:hypothetical protein
MYTWAKIVLICPQLGGFKDMIEDKNKINIKELDLIEPDRKGAKFPFDPMEYFTYKHWEIFQMDAAHALMDFHKTDNHFEKFVAIKHIGELKLLGQGILRINYSPEILTEIRNEFNNFDQNNTKALRAINNIAPSFNIFTDDDWRRLKNYHKGQHTVNSHFNTAALVAQVEPSRLREFMPTDSKWNTALKDFSTSPLAHWTDILKINKLADIKLVDPKRFDDLFLKNGNADTFISFAANQLDDAWKTALTTDERRYVVNLAVNLFILSASKIDHTEEGLRISLSKDKKNYNQPVSIPERRRF